MAIVGSSKKMMGIISITICLIANFLTSPDVLTSAVKVAKMITQELSGFGGGGVLTSPDVCTATKVEEYVQLVKRSPVVVKIGKELVNQGGITVSDYYNKVKRVFPVTKLGLLNSEGKFYEADFQFQNNNPTRPQSGAEIAQLVPTHCTVKVEKEDLYVVVYEPAKGYPAIYQEVVDMGYAVGEDFFEEGVTLKFGMLGEEFGKQVHMNDNPVSQFYYEFQCFPANARMKHRIGDVEKVDGQYRAKIAEEFEAKRKMIDAANDKISQDELAGAPSVGKEILYLSPQVKTLGPNTVLGVYTKAAFVEQPENKPDAYAFVNLVSTQRALTEIGSVNYCRDAPE